MMRLLKALHGTKEAAKVWYSHFSGTLLEYGYRKSELGKCVLHKEESDGSKSTCVTHVDGGSVMASDPVTLAFLHSKLKASEHSTTLLYWLLCCWLAPALLGDERVAG